MKILFFTSSFEDYLQDQLIIGLRSLLGSDLVDYPQKQVLYASSKKKKENLYGCGFTIWKTLPDIKIDRKKIKDRIKSNEFDVIIFGSIWRQSKPLKKYGLGSIMSKARLIFIDGEDHSQIVLKVALFADYYKREKSKNIYSLLVKNIGFSIPSGKIRTNKPIKTKQFAKHNQCPEAYKIEAVKKHCVLSYAFSNEEEYYEDIAQSEYAITMKKGGWDCMRHYEIAANFTIPCFYQLSTKPADCAPHGLIDMVNVVGFNSAEELQNKIDIIKDQGLYSSIQKNVISWINNNSSEIIAKNMISAYVN